MRWSIQELFWNWKDILEPKSIRKIPSNIYLFFYIFFYWLRHGHTDYSLWNLDGFLIKVLIARIKRFRKSKEHKVEMNNEDDLWYPEARKFQVKLDMIIEGFELYNDHYSYLNDSPEGMKIKKAFDLFKNNFGRLWD